MKLRLFTSFVLILVTLTCSKTDQEKTEHQMAGKLEEQVTLSELNYDSLRVLLDTLSQHINDDIMNVEHRMKLVEAAYDTSADVIYAIGHGKAPLNSASPEIAMRLAERAAEIEAKRMVANIKTWSLYPARIDTMPITSYIPPATIVAQHINPDSSVQVLLKVNANEIR